MHGGSGGGGWGALAPPVRRAFRTIISLMDRGLRRRLYVVIPL